MAGQDLKRLRLKYEGSMATCHWCGHRGIVGEELKLFTQASQGKGDPSPQYRCADRQGCERRARAKAESSPPPA